MRRSHNLLLVGSNEDILSPLRFTLSNARPKSGVGCYSVTTAQDVQEAVESLKTNTFDLLVVKSPLASLETLLECARKIQLKSVVLAQREDRRVDCDVFLKHSTNEILLLWVRDLVKKAKGPMKGSPAAKRCGKRKPVTTEISVVSAEEVA